jgi:hypothetical protein
MKVDGMIKEIREKKNIDIKKVILMSGMFISPQTGGSCFSPDAQKTKRTQSSGKK